MRRAAALGAAAALCLVTPACTGGDGDAPAAPVTGAARQTPTPPASTGPARTTFAAPIPDCVAIVAMYPQGIYRSVGPYPGGTDKPEADLQYRTCNTAGKAAAADDVTLTTVITIYRPTTDPYRGIPLATWLPQRAGELVDERCSRVAAWGGADGGRRCSAGAPGGVANAVVAGVRNGAVLRAEVSGELPRSQVESASARIATAILTELT